MKTQEGSKITRITPKQASKFIACDDDQLSTPAEYFTLTPSSNPERPISEGWEDVRYYTNRPRHIQMPKGIVNCQWIYILSNTTMPGLVKIGFTKNRPGERAKQINAATGVAIARNHAISPSPAPALTITVIPKKRTITP